AHLHYLAPLGDETAGGPFEDPAARHPRGEAPVEVLEHLLPLEAGATQPQHHLSPVPARDLDGQQPVQEHLPLQPVLTRLAQPRSERVEGPGKPEALQQLAQFAAQAHATPCRRASSCAGVRAKRGTFTVDEAVASLVPSSASFTAS